jgi:hypothetical protein
MKIKQIWVRYDEWEDYHAGMWRKVERAKEGKLLNDAVLFTGNHVEYGAAMLKVVFSWPRTMLNSLSNPSINQRAFVGHCAACFKIGTPEYITRQAWGLLTDQQRQAANNEASKAIEAWRIFHFNKQQYKIQFPEYA